ncbi:hypothetical protein GQ600_675 [Phytophthora cactorum]|nr:hypothetical protein GQ600_675 [Phytophthora cactorum]
MGNAAAVQSVAESSRRRLLLQQYNRQPRTVLVSNSLMQAFEQRRLQSLQPQLAHSFHRSKQTQQGSSNKESLQSLPLNEIYDVLTDRFRVQLTLEELPIVLRHLGCRVVESPTAASNSDPLMSGILCRGYWDTSLPGEYCAAKMGDLEVLEAVYELLRCVTNALNQHTRALLQQRMTLEEVLKAKAQDADCGENGEDDDSEEGAWFGLLADDG